MKLFDLRLRGSNYTIGTLVNDEDHFNFRSVIGDLQGQNLDNEEVEVPVSFKLDEDETKEKITEWLLREGYATLSGDEFTFTEKAIQLFAKIIAKHEELDNDPNFRPRMGCFNC